MRNGTRTVPTTLKPDLASACQLGIAAAQDRLAKRQETGANGTLSRFAVKRDRERFAEIDQTAVNAQGEIFQVLRLDVRLVAAQGDVDAGSLGRLGG